MKLRYMMEFKFVRRRGSQASRYVPIGVWVVGLGDGLDLTARFLPGHNRAKKRVEEILARMEQYGMRFQRSLC